MYLILSVKASYFEITKMKCLTDLKHVFQPDSWQRKQILMGVNLVVVVWMWQETSILTHLRIRSSRVDVLTNFWAS